MRQQNYPREEISKTSRGNSNNVAIEKQTIIGYFFTPGFQLRDGIPSNPPHPGLTELTVYREFYKLYISIFTIIFSLNRNAKSLILHNITEINLNKDIITSTFFCSR